MPQYLHIAENIYTYMEKEKHFNNSFQDYLNLIVKRLRDELKDTDLKLIYNYIEFVEGFVENTKEGSISFDLSLIPNYKNQVEFTLWLAKFIEDITEGGVKKIPPLLNEVPPEFYLDIDLQFHLNKIIKCNASADKIISYFQSDEFQKVNL